MKLLIFIAGFYLAVVLSNKPDYTVPCKAELRCDYYKKGRYVMKIISSSWVSVNGLKNIDNDVVGIIDADSMSVRIVYPERINFKNK